jgi:hypothetical protein
VHHSRHLPECEGEALSRERLTCPAARGPPSQRKRHNRSSCGWSLDNPLAASVLQASGFRSDVTVFRLHATADAHSGSESAFLRNTAERVYTIEAAHNPEVAGSNPAPATAKGPGNGAFSLSGPERDRQLSKRSCKYRTHRIRRRLRAGWIDEEPIDSISNRQADPPIVRLEKTELERLQSHLVDVEPSGSRHVLRWQRRCDPRRLPNTSCAWSQHSD